MFSIKEKAEHENLDELIYDACKPLLNHSEVLSIEFRHSVASSLKGIRINPRLLNQHVQDLINELENGNDTTISISRQELALAILAFRQYYNNPDNIIKEL